jgi:WXG100 family type VII secretion target
MSQDQPLSVNFSRMYAVSEHLKSTIEFVTGQLGDLERHAAPLVAGWSGEAKAAYDQRQKTWHQASQELVAVLTSIRRAVDESMMDYGATEHQNVRLFTG